MTPVEALIKGRDFLAEHKWGRQDYYNEDTGAYCAVGALWCGNFGSNYWEKESSLIETDLWHTVNNAERLLNAASPSTYSITNYNDYTAKRKRDVISVFNKAIKLAQTEGRV